MKKQKNEQKLRLNTKEDEEKSSQKDISPKPRIVRAGNRPNAVFKKKAKDYTEQLENKFLEKKKELLAQNDILDKVKNMEKKKKERTKSNMPKPPKDKRGMLKPESENNIPKRRVSANIFDNIHAILDNPKEKITI